METNITGPSGGSHKVQEAEQGHNESERSKTLIDADEDDLLQRLSKFGHLIDETKLTCSPGVSEFYRNKLEAQSKRNWDQFYKRNGDRFFKNRYWIRNQYTELFTTSNVTTSQNDDKKFLLEVGCGCGNFVIPLLEPRVLESSDLTKKDESEPITIKARDDLYIYCCDISNRAIELLRSHESYKSNHPARISAFQADITDQCPAHLVDETHGNLMDYVSLIFVLSALEPEKMKSALRNISKLTVIGGLVFVRDYAIYDATMLRFKQESKICDKFYARQDGTRAYFFTKEELRKLFAEFQFECIDIEYVERETVNNATLSKFNRVFLQAKFKKINNI